MHYLRIQAVFQFKDDSLTISLHSFVNGLVILIIAVNKYPHTWNQGFEPFSDAKSSRQCISAPVAQTTVNGYNETTGYKISFSPVTIRFGYGYQGFEIFGFGYGLASLKIAC